MTTGGVCVYNYIVMANVKKDKKGIMPVYLRKSKIMKIKRYAANKNMKGQSAVVDEATDLLFQTRP